MPNIEFHPWSEDAQNLIDLPTPTHRNVPEWYRKQPAYVNKEEFLKKGVSGSTIKKCMDSTYYLRVPFVFEYGLKYNESTRYKFSHKWS